MPRPDEGAEGPRLAAPIPILRIFDEAKAREFYLGWLGFAVLFEHRFAPGLPLYLGVRLGACELHLSEHHGDACPGAALRIGVSDLDGFHARLSAAGYRYARPGIQAVPWGFREMRLTDPFGNRLVFAEPLPAA